jgi:hypothetical protein
MREVCCEEVKQKECQAELSCHLGVKYLKLIDIVASQEFPGNSKTCGASTPKPISGGIFSPN